MPGREQVMKEACDNMNFLEATVENKLVILNSLCAYYTNNIHRCGMWKGCLWRRSTQ
jgi:hypothetical protein